MKIKVGIFKEVKTWIWQDGIEIDLPEKYGTTENDIDFDKYMEDLKLSNPEKFEELEEFFEDSDIIKEKPASDDESYWIEDENGKTIL